MGQRECSALGGGWGLSPGSLAGEGAPNSKQSTVYHSCQAQGQTWLQSHHEPLSLLLGFASLQVLVVRRALPWAM